MPDFGLLQMPNFAQAALGGYAAGQKIGAQQRLDSALQGVDLTRPESIVPVLKADPSTGMGLLSASTQLATAHREAAGREALGTYLLNHFGKGGGQASGVTQGGAALVPPAASPNEVAPNGDIVITGQRPAPVTPPAPAQPDSSEADLIRADPHAYLSIRENLDKLDKGHREAVAAAADAQAALVPQLKALPLAERQAFAMKNAPMLAQYGVTADQIASADYSDAGLDTLMNHALGVKGVLDQQNKARDDARADATLGLSRERFAHDVAQDVATLGVSRGNLAVSQGNLALARSREGREVAKAGGAATGAGTIAAPTSRADYDKLAKGTRYRAPDGSVRIK